MPITSYDRHQIEKLHERYKAKYKGREEDYFALHYLCRAFKIDNPDDVIRQVAFGNRDYGIDSYYIDRLTRNLYLYQFKWSESHNLFKESLDRLIKDGMARIFCADCQDPSQNDLLLQLNNDLNEAKNMIERVYIQFVFKGDLEAAENNAGLQERRDALLDKRYLVNSYFGRDIELIFEFVADRRTGRKPIPPSEYQASISSVISNELLDGEAKMYIGLIPLSDVYGMWKCLGNELLSRNIRAGLSPDNPPNKKIRAALDRIVIKKSEPPDRFAFLHNGITLAAERVIIEDSKVKIYVPKILNGAQTITTVSKFIDDNTDNPAFKNNREIFNQIYVLAKIVVADPQSDLITEITISNNQQNPVEPWNLRANDQIQCDLQDKFREQAKIYYSRQENAFKALSDEDMELKEIEEKRDIQIKKLAQTFLASQGEVDKISRHREVFENNNIYNDTFRKSYYSTDVRRLVLAYKVGLVLNASMDTLLNKSPEKYEAAVKNSRNLVWCLAIQGIFNDKNIEDYLEEYGTTMVKDQGLREALSRIASSKIWPVLYEIYHIKIYDERIRKGKYDFSKAKEVYKKAMDIAARRFGWKKVQL